MAQGEDDSRWSASAAPATRYPQPPAAGAARLTLVTAEGAGRLAALTPGLGGLRRRRRAKKGFPAPSGLPATVPDAGAGHGQRPGALPLLALCLALLLAVTLGVVAARQRWSDRPGLGRRQPPSRRPAWSTTDVVMRLLPNVI